MQAGKLNMVGLKCCGMFWGKICPFRGITEILKALDPICLDLYPQQLLQRLFLLLLPSIFPCRVTASKEPFLRLVVRYIACASLSAPHLFSAEFPVA